MRHISKKILAAFTGAFALLLMVGSVAEATPVLRFTTSGGIPVTKTVVDNSVDDLDATVGVISFNGSLSGGTGCAAQNWSINITTGTSYPTLGSATNPSMNINSLNVSNCSAGTLKIEFTDVFTVGNLNYAGSYFGSTPGIVGYNVYGGATQFSQAAQVLGGTVSGAFGAPHAFAGAFGPAGFNPATNPVWLTQVITIQHLGFGETTRGDFSVAVVAPEPTSLLLLGAGLVGIALKRRSTLR